MEAHIGNQIRTLYQMCKVYLLCKVADLVPNVKKCRFGY